KKYEAMERAMCSDGRVHGLLQFYGASRTGRWAGRVVQVQNLARNYLKDLDDARNYVKARDIDAVEILYDSLNDTLKQLVRTAFVAEGDKEFYVSDFSAIEARVIAWYAKEQWRLEVFSTHGKIYEASASQMFH
ncbi:DNA polymerase, partial [Streptococcus suis]